MLINELGGGDTMMWWGHSNLTFCKRISLSTLQSKAVKKILSSNKYKYFN